MNYQEKLPFAFKRFLKNVYYAFFDRFRHLSHKNYIFSDEKLKFTHILEGINYMRVAGNNGKDLPLTYFEFGCHSGRTFSAAINAAKYLKMHNCEFFAFDSFQGLPQTNEAVDGIFKTGEFSTSREDFIKIIKQKTKFNENDINIIEGFYETSLTGDLQSKMPKIGMLHIDVDLYSSTKDILKFAKPLLVNGSLVLFDDWYCFKPSIKNSYGEQKAVNEFLDINKNIKLLPWKAYSTFGQSFFVNII
jgi:O-methyltransferase